MQIKSVLLGLIFSVMLASQAWSQISYRSTSFESLATAETDAGPEYSYVINRGDEVGPNGLYNYSESGTAPGYSSSASVLVEHASQLGASGFTLTGKARGYVADDYGYAWCSANSEALVSLTFTLRRQQRVSIVGSLALTGSSQPEGFSNYFELRRANGSLVTSSSGVGPIAYKGRLAAGTYTVYVSSSVFRELNFSGGDAYENSTASFDVTLSAR